MSKHTPGPWRLNRRFCFNVEDQNGRTIARINWDHETYDEAMANARLIAAAPELLDKCEWAQLYIRKLECSCKPEVPCWRCIVLEKLNDAIAKARGEVTE